MVKTCGNTTVHDSSWNIHYTKMLCSGTTSSLLSDNHLKYMMKTGVVPCISFRSFTLWMFGGQMPGGRKASIKLGLWIDTSTVPGETVIQNMVAWLHLCD